MIFQSYFLEIFKRQVLNILKYISRILFYLYPEYIFTHFISQTVGLFLTYKTNIHTLLKFRNSIFNLSEQNSSGKTGSPKPCPWSCGNMHSYALIDENENRQHFLKEFVSASNSICVTFKVAIVCNNLYLGDSYTCGKRCVHMAKLSIFFFLTIGKPQKC